MKKPPALRTFPIDDLRNRLFIPHPLLVGVSIEIEDVSLVVATGDREDALGFYSPFSAGFLVALSSVESRTSYS